jgi:hypothetical protein
LFFDHLQSAHIVPIFPLVSGMCLLRTEENDCQPEILQHFVYEEGSEQRVIANVLCNAWRENIAVI